MNDSVVIIYSVQQVSVPKEVADFLEQDRTLEQAQEKQDKRHLSKSEFETVLSGSDCVRRPMEDEVLWNLQLETLRKAVDGLGDQGRDLVELRYGRGLTMEEIGTIYGVSKAAEKVPRTVEGLCQMTEPLNFFYFLVYKLPVSVLISRGQNFRLPETPALAVAGNASAKVHRGAMTMNLFGARQKQLLSFLTANAERETLDYVLQGMKEVLGDEMPEEDAVRAYLQDPDEPISLSTEQQIVALDKLLECAEVNLRTLCDLIRYQQLKDAGVVNSVEEFLRLVRPDAARDIQEEDAH